MASCGSSPPDDSRDGSESIGEGSDCLALVAPREGEFSHIHVALFLESVE